MSRRVLDKNFCVIPWTGFEVEPNGDVKNCIISKNVIGNLKENSIEEIVQKNSSLRQEMLEGKFPKNCEGCYLQEKHRGKDFGSISSRLYYAKEITPYLSKGILESPDNFKLHHVDVRWSNKCNFACVYCGSLYSSKWATELGEKLPKDQRSKDSLKKYLYSNVKNLRNIYLAGGEPMLMKENKEFLELLLKENPEVNIRVNTNLSKTRTGVFDLLCQFKNVHWTVSVESMEKEFEYVRFHGAWKEFLDNLKIIRKNDHKISLNMLYFVLNYKSIFNTIDFFKSLGLHNNSFVLGPLYTPIALNILNLPNKVLNECKDLFQKQIDKKPGFLLQNSYENVLSYLTDTTFNANIVSTKKELEKMDKRRNIDSSKIFQQFYKEVF
jgi:radical SAM protein with 4Fe4S-binding SPASM domain